MCALAWASLATTALPPPSGAGAPADAFSAERAAVHLQALARTPRPIASSMNEQAREYIVAQLRGMGLQPEVQVATAVRQSVDNYHNVHVTLAVVHNIVARKPGAALDHARRPALLLASHYDSDPATQGASDAASAAAMLETARAMQSGPPPAGDVMFLFADGDRVGAMGEQAFAEQHPLAQRVGLTLRFQHLGNDGPVVLQRAHGAAGAAISAWARGPSPRGSSLVSEATSLMPQARGSGPLASLRAPLLQFGAVEGRLGSWDTPQRFARATLQHEGDTMLSLAQALGARPLGHAAASGDQVYFTAPALGMVHYPASATWTITSIACLLLACVCAAAIEGDRLELTGIVKGAFGYALIAGGPLAVLYLDGLHGAFSHVIAPDASGLHYEQGVALLIAGLFVLGQRMLCARIGALAAALGALACLAAGLAAVTWLAPGISYLLAWPLIAATIALAAQLSPRVQALTGWMRFSLLLAGVLPAIALAMPAARDIFAMPTRFRIHIPLWLLMLVMGTAVALLGVAARRLAVRATVIVGAALLAIPGSASVPDKAPPGPNPLVYYKDMPTWSEWWLSRQSQPDQWTRQLFPDQVRAVKLVDVLGWNSHEVWYAKAPRNEIVFPHAIMLVNDKEPARRIVFDLTSKNSAPRIELHVGGGKPWRARMNEQLLSYDPEIRNWSMSIYGIRDQRMHFDLEMFGGIVGVGVEEHIPGLPDRSLAVPEPAGAYIPMSGETVAADMLWFR
ncbi:hypothetical protein GCM10027321_36740 [Massilia terrae]